VLGPGQPGEVRVRGPNVMAGYWNRPDETAKALREGWFYSGDIGYLDEDHYLVLVDRKKDMIISGGENVYPAEVEKVLEQHAAVAEVAVVGRPDAKWGEVPVAFVVLRTGHPATADELIEFCSSRIARYKTPKEVVVRDALPRNAAGKILKPELRRLLTGG
jgi:acyl-CoA synthetase (AMP-forming)/AMP-acid ligase II